MIRDNTKDINTPKVPTAREIYMALNVRLKRSLPDLSVPKICIPPSFTPNYCSSFVIPLILKSLAVPCIFILNSYVIISKIKSGNVPVKPIPLNPVTIRDRFRKKIGLVSYL